VLWQRRAIAPHMDARRRFLKTFAVSAIAPTLLGRARGYTTASPSGNFRHFHFVQIDVFTSQRLEGNPLSVFTDARGLSDSEMQGLARETNLQETTFVLPRETGVEAHEGVKVRIFTPDEEIPFGGHPTLGTATVLRTLRMGSGTAKMNDALASTVVLDLKVGKVPVSFHESVDGLFGEMQQVPPVFGRVHERSTVATVLGLNADDIEPDPPIQTVSTGLPFVIVPIKRLSTLQHLHVAPQKAYEYLKQEQGLELGDFYYVTRDTGDPKIGLRARAIYSIGEDPATGSAAGCTSAWMVKYGVVQPDETVLILQGVEVKRPSRIFVRSSKTGNDVSNVRVGGHAVQIMEGKVCL
jgi:trans-2,3-dihydro-3-hydroxyanthranilate isomerase